MKQHTGTIAIVAATLGILAGTNGKQLFNPTSMWQTVTGQVTTMPEPDGQCTPEEKVVDLWGRHTIGESVTLTMDCQGVDSLPDPFPLTLDGFDMDVATEGRLWVNSHQQPLFPPGDPDCDEYQRDPPAGHCTKTIEVPRGALVEGENLLKFEHLETSGYRVDSIQTLTASPNLAVPLPDAVVEIGDADTVYAVVISDEEGNYSAYVPQGAVVEATVLGQLCPADGVTPPPVEPPVEPPSNGNDNSSPDPPPIVDAVTVCDVGCDADTLQEGLGLVPDGGTLLVRPGRYNSGTTRRATPALDVVGRSEVTIRGEPGAIIEGTNGGDGTEVLLNIKSSTGIRVEGLHFRNARRNAVRVEGNSRAIVLRHLDSRDTDKEARFIGGAIRVVSPAREVLIEECVISGGSMGIETRESPTLSNSTGNVPNAGWDPMTGVAGGVMDVTVRRCVVFNNTLREEHSDGISMRYCTDCVVENSAIYGNADDGIDMLGCTRPVVRGNIVFSHRGIGDGDGNGIKVGVRGAAQALVEGNVCFDNNRGSVDMADTISGIVRANTLVGSPGQRWFGFWTEPNDPGDGLIVIDNIVTGHSKGDIGCNGGVVLPLFANNWIGDASLHNWRCTGGDFNDFGSDPGYRRPDLDVQSPARGHATEMIESIRQQVTAKYGLVPDAPATGKGAL